MVARLTPDQKVACSIHVGFKFLVFPIFSSTLVSWPYPKQNQAQIVATPRIDRKLLLSQAQLNQNWASVYDGRELTKDPKILENYLSFIISHTKPTHPLQALGYKFSMSSFQVSHTCLSFDKPKVCGNWSLSCSHNVIHFSHLNPSY